MNRLWRFAALISLSIVILLSACTQASTPPAPSAEKPVEKAAAKPAETAAEKPVEKVAEKPAEKAEAKPAAKVEAKPAAPKDLPSTIAMGTPPVGSSYHSTGTGIAKVTSDRSPIKVIIKPFAGPQAWMPLLESGEVHLGTLNAMDAGWAYSGGRGFDKAYPSIRMVLRGNQIPTAVMAVRADSNIKTIKDLKGKRVASDYGGHVVMHTQLTVWLESGGLAWDDVKPVPVADLVSGQKALREGRADAAFGASTTTATSLETDAAIGIRVLDFGDIPPEQGDNPPQAMTDLLRKYLPGASIYRQKKEGWLKSDATLIKYPTVLAASTKLSADAVYEITKTLYDNDKELHPIYDWLKGWQQATMFDPAPSAPYHEGAIRFWKEKGVWTAEAEANQKKLLGQ